MNNEPTLTSLQDFVQTALDQIGKALEGKQVKDFFIPVTFELGIVAVHNKVAKTEGGVSLGVASVLRLGSGGQSATKENQTEYNRISFTVPLVLDPQKTKIEPGVAVL